MLENEEQTHIRETEFPEKPFYAFDRGTNPLLAELRSDHNQKAVNSLVLGYNRSRRVKSVANFLRSVQRGDSGLWKVNLGPAIQD